MQPVTNRRGAAAIPVWRQYHAQQRQQIESDCTQLEVNRICVNFAAGQLRGSKITAKLLDAILRCIGALIVKPHNLMIGQLVQIQVGGNGPVQIFAASGTFIIRAAEQFRKQVLLRVFLSLPDQPPLHDYEK